MSIVTKDLGVVTAYGYAVAGGYTGTENEFKELLANLGIENVVLNIADPNVEPSASLEGDTLTLTLKAASDEQVSTYLDEWLEENISQETGYVLDRSLESAESAAPADLVGHLKSAACERIESATVTQTINNETIAGITISALTNNTLQIYGSPTLSRHLIFLNGQDGVKTTSSAFSKTLSAGTYDIQFECTGHRNTAVFYYTASTFSSKTRLYSGTVTFQNDVMIGLYMDTAQDWGTSEEPSVISFSAKRIVANDIVSRARCTNLENALSGIQSNIVDPDSFTGTDSEKITAAMNSIGNTGHGVILIKRLYTIGNSVKISHLASSDARIIFLGIGKDCGFKRTYDGYLFMAYDGSTSYGMVSFENICFKSEVGANIHSEYLIRMTFTNCVFSGGSNAVKNERYMQSWHFNGCTFRNYSSYVIYSRLKTNSDSVTPQLYDVVFNGCLVERCAGFLYTQALRGVTISECCIEGLWGYVCNVTSEARQLNVVNNYFEHNNNRWSPDEYDPSDPTGHNGYTGGRYGVNFEFSSLANNLSEIQIIGNIFVTAVYAPDDKNTLILLPVNRPKIGFVTIENNHVSYGNNIYLVKANDNATLIYRNVILRNNLNYNYDGGENNLLIDSSAASLASCVELSGSDDVNELSNPGIYHASSDNLPDHSPINGEFYLLHIRGEDSIAQIAITEEGIVGRIGTGEFM